MAEAGNKVELEALVLAPLTPEEAQALEVEERRVTEGFEQAAQALAAIRDRRLYRGDGRRTFEAYCRERWGMSRTNADRQIGAAEVVALVAPIGATPASESVARELTHLRSQPELLRRAWEATVEEHGPRPTAAQTRAVVQAYRPEPEPELAPVASNGAPSAGTRALGQHKKMLAGIARHADGIAMVEQHVDVAVVRQIPDSEEMERWRKDLEAAAAACRRLRRALSRSA